MKRLAIKTAVVDPVIQKALNDFAQACDAKFRGKVYKYNVEDMETEEVTVVNCKFGKTGGYAEGDSVSFGVDLDSDMQDEQAMDEFNPNESYIAEMAIKIIRSVPIPAPLKALGFKVPTSNFDVIAVDPESVQFSFPLNRGTNLDETFFGNSA